MARSGEGGSLLRSARSSRPGPQNVPDIHKSVVIILVQVCTQVDSCGKGPRVATNAPHAWLFDSRRRGGTCLGRHERQVVQTLLRAVGTVHPFLPYILRIVGVNCVGPGVLLQ